MSAATVSAERTKPTHEKFANVPRVVHTALQFPASPCIVDPDLNGSGVYQRQVWLESERIPRKYLRILPSFFPYTSSSGISAGRHRWASDLAEGVALGHRNWKIQHRPGALDNVEEVRVRMAQGQCTVVGASLANGFVLV